MKKMEKNIPFKIDNYSDNKIFTLLKEQQVQKFHFESSRNVSHAINPIPVSNAFSSISKVGV